MRRKSDIIRNFFVYDESCDKNTCRILVRNTEDDDTKGKICNQKIKGDKASNLKKHVETKHSEMYQKYIETVAGKSSASVVSVSIQSENLKRGTMLRTLLTNFKSVPSVNSLDGISVTEEESAVEENDDNNYDEGFVNIECPAVVDADQVEDCDYLLPRVHHSTSVRSTLKRKRSATVDRTSDSFSNVRSSDVTAEDRFDVFGKNVALKLKCVPKSQRIWAEKIISDTLLEAEMGNLNRHCATRISHLYNNYSVQYDEEQLQQNSQSGNIIESIYIDDNSESNDDGD